MPTIIYVYTILLLSRCYYCAYVIVNMEESMKGSRKYMVFAR